MKKDINYELLINYLDCEGPLYSAVVNLGVPHVGSSFEYGEPVCGFIHPLGMVNQCVVSFILWVW